MATFIQIKQVCINMKISLLVAPLITIQKLLGFFAFSVFSNILKTIFCGYQKASVHS